MFIIVEKLTGWHKNETKSFLHHAYAIFVVVIGWVVFRADTLSYAVEYLKNMFGFVRGRDISYTTAYYIDNIEIIAFAIAALCAMPVCKNILFVRNKAGLVLVNLGLVLLFVLAVASMAASTYNPFIYFRF